MNMFISLSKPNLVIVFVALLGILSIAFGLPVGAAYQVAQHHWHVFLPGVYRVLGYIGVLSVVLHGVSDLLGGLSLLVAQVVHCADVSSLEVVQLGAVANEKVAGDAVLVELNVHFEVVVLLLFEEICLCLLGDVECVHRISLVEFGLVLGDACVHGVLQKLQIRSHVYAMRRGFGNHQARKK